MEEHAEEIFNALDTGAHIYFCGLKGMMPGIQVCVCVCVFWGGRLLPLL
jgi:hypothetical protein